MYLVAWPLNESEAGVDLVLTETSLLFFCKLLLISMININAGRFLSKKVHPSLFFTQRPGNYAHNSEINGPLKNAIEIMAHFNRENFIATSFFQCCTARCHMHLEV